MNIRELKEELQKTQGKDIKIKQELFEKIQEENRRTDIIKSPIRG